MTLQPCQLPRRLLLLPCQTKRHGLVSLTTTTTTTTAAASTRSKRAVSSRRRGRTPKSLSSNRPSPATMTTRQRIRRLVEYNQVDRSSLLRASQRVRVQQLLHTAQGRMLWLRNQLYSFWNPDLNPTTKATTTTTALEPQKMRPVKRLVMDERWFMWNLAFAMVPALLIAVYCEFRGQYLMYDFRQELERQQLKQFLGEETFRVMEENGSVQAFLEKNEKPRHVLQRLHDGANEYMNQIKVLVEGLTTEKQQVDRDKEGKEESKSNQSAIPSEPKKEEPTSLLLTRHDKDKSGEVIQPTLHQASTRRAAASDSSLLAPKSSGNVSTEELLRRIKELEALIVQHQQNQLHKKEQQPPYPMDTQVTQTTIAQAQESGIRSRMQERLLEKWRNRGLEIPSSLTTTSTPAATTQPTTTSTPSSEPLGVGSTWPQPTSNATHDEEPPPPQAKFLEPLKFAMDLYHWIWRGSDAVIMPNNNQTDPDPPKAGSTNAENPGNPSQIKARDAKPTVSNPH